MLPLVIVFIIVPLIEIALFIQIGGWLTLWPTLAIVVATAVIGAWLVRMQGMRVLAGLQQALEEGGDPVSPMAHGAMILFSGALLLTPGFLTDAVGFLLLIPAFRKLILHTLARYGMRKIVVVHGTTQSREARRDGDIIDPKFREIDPEGSQAPQDGGNGAESGSPWSGTDRPPHRH